MKILKVVSSDYVVTTRANYWIQLSSKNKFKEFWMICRQLTKVSIFFCQNKLRAIQTLLTPKPSLKIGTAIAICWNSLSLFRDYGLNYTFFRNKTFLFFKIESWNFQHLFEKEFRETSFSSFRQFLFPFFLSVVWLSWNFVRFHEILFK